jgi:uncharacterized OsmC-like protein
MLITATIQSAPGKNQVSVSTNDSVKSIEIPCKPGGKGSSVNRGELLFLSLATCYCNDIYREAAKRKMDIEKVDVDVIGSFGKEGEPASDITYSVKIQSPHSVQEIEDLIAYVDRIAEIHNTLRKGIEVTLKKE